MGNKNIFKIADLFLKKAVRMVNVGDEPGKPVVTDYNKYDTSSDNKPKQNPVFDPLSLLPTLTPPANKDVQPVSAPAPVPDEPVADTPTPALSNFVKTLGQLRPHEQVKLKELQLKGLSIEDSVNVILEDRKNEKIDKKRHKALEQSLEKSKEKFKKPEVDFKTDESFVTELHKEINEKYDIHFSTLEYEKILRAIHARNPSLELNEETKNSIKAEVESYILANLHKLKISEEAVALKGEVDNQAKIMDSLIQVSKLEAAYKRAADKSDVKLWDYVAKATNNILEKYFPQKLQELQGEYETNKRAGFEQYKNYLNAFSSRAEKALKKISKAEVAEVAKAKNQPYSQEDINSLAEDSFALRLKDNMDDAAKVQGILNSVVSYNMKKASEVDAALKAELKRIDPSINVDDKTFSEFLSEMGQKYNNIKALYHEKSNRGDALFSTVLQGINSTLPQGEARITEQALGLSEPADKKKKIEEGKNKQVSKAKPIQQTVDRLLNSVRSNITDDPRSVEEKAKEALEFAKKKFMDVKERISNAEMTFIDHKPSGSEIKEANKNGKVWFEIQVPVSAPERKQYEEDVKSLSSDISSKISRTKYPLNFVSELLKEISEPQFARGVSVQKKHDGLKNLTRSAFEQLRSYEERSKRTATVPVVTTSDLATLLYKLRAANSKAFEASSRVMPVEYRQQDGSIGYDVAPEQIDTASNPNIRKVWVLVPQGEDGKDQAETLKKLWEEKSRIEDATLLLQNGLK